MERNYYSLDPPSSDSGRAVWITRESGKKRGISVAKATYKKSSLLLKVKHLKT
jgi:hypothetical protein